MPSAAPESVKGIVEMAGVESAGRERALRANSDIFMDIIHIHTLIGSRGHIVWWQMMIRAVLILFYGLLLVRFAGRRMFGKLTALDIILAVLIGSNLSRTLTANAPFLPTLAATAGIMLVYWLLMYASMRVPVISWIVKGRPILLVRDGEVNHGKMNRLGIGERDLAEAMRGSGVTHLRAIKEAYLERDGSISILKK